MNINVTCFKFLTTYILEIVHEISHVLNGPIYPIPCALQAFQLTLHCIAHLLAAFVLFDCAHTIVPFTLL